MDTKEFATFMQRVDLLSDEQKAILRHKLNDEWSRDFGRVVGEIRASVPADISEEEVMADIEEAIREVRTGHPK